jgi:hypothetical protein
MWHVSRGDKFSQPRDFFFRKRRIVRRSKDGENFPAPRARRKVHLAGSGFLLPEFPLVVGGD